MMTNIQLLRHLIGNIVELSDEALGIALELEELVPAGQYSSDDRCKIYAIAISLIQTNKGVRSETEGGYSITYSDAGIPAAISALANASKCKDLIDQYVPRPKLKDKSYLW